MATLAIVGGSLIDGTGADPRPNTTLIIEDDIIQSIGTDTPIPNGATTIDARGLTVMPGLIDSHVHLCAPGADFDLLKDFLRPPSFKLFYAVPNCKATLEAGFTTVRDAAGTPAGVKMAVDAGLIVGPRILVSITALSQTGGHSDGYLPSCIDPEIGNLPDVPRSVVDGVDDMRKRVREILRAGADWIKMCTTGGVLSPSDDPSHTLFTLDEIRAAVYEAAAQGKRVMAHAQGTQGIKNAVEAGIASIEHGIWLDDEVIAMMKAKGTYLVPTLIAPEEVLKVAETKPGAMPPWAAPKARAVIGDHRASFRRAVEAGVLVAMGTDTGVGAHGTNARELAVMVEFGMTTMQSIVAATRTAAELLRLDHRLGTLETGKLADLLIVNGDPLTDISILQDKTKLAAIFKGGQAVKNTLA